LYGFTQRLVKYSIFIRNVILTIQRAEELWDGSAERLGYRLVARMRNMNEIVERESYMYVDLFQALAD